MRNFIPFLVVAALLSGCALNNPAPKYLIQEQSAPPQAPGKESAVTPSQQGANIGSFNSPQIDNVHERAKNFDGQAGLYAKNLKTGQSISLHADRIFPTASTHKLVVALAIYKYMYTQASQTKKKQYDQHIKNMIVVSDNPAFYSLLKEIENTQPDALSRVLSDLGLVKTRIHSGEAFRQYGYHSVTTPQEMSVVFETIYNEAYLGQEFSAILKEELGHTIFRDEIPRMLPNRKVYHKVGALPGVLCDVGLVDDGHDQIIISVYSTSKRGEEYASDFLADVSAKAYQALRSK